MASQLERSPDVSGTTEIPYGKIREFCKRRRIVELSLFGSYARGEAKAESDVDVLVVFAPATDHSISEWLDMIDELKEIFDREVDLVEKSLVRNPFRRREILRTRKVDYAADGQ